jgi:hypothetical protein
MATESAAAVMGAIAAEANARIGECLLGDGNGEIKGEAPD